MFVQTGAELLYVLNAEEDLFSESILRDGVVDNIDNPVFILNKRYLEILKPACSS